MVSEEEAGVAEPRNIERIRAAALRSLAANGAAGTTMRGVAAAAGVSLGLVQHHFVTKAGLIKAVDEYVLELTTSTMSRPLSEPPVDSVAEIGDRVSNLFTEEPDVAAYVGRALVDGSPLGAEIFDTLFAVGVARWQRRKERGELRPDVDVTWAAINAMVLALGAISLRPHLDRHLAEPLISPPQLQRWQTAVDMLLREGLLRRPESD
ncbi:TetR/AcrR family transcriptional regulator [Mycobacterium sp. ITM-2016-00317]|uniref:TetR/AcrR family transcriptional regulator n=1 Tax=Mycobacterium sp. ITM-2016-00317 TaxID=2099694 RepID=UPI000D4079CE|nr:TetR/AcrR family transcriptional regulator [Mycobacterium sp. ITM-2016-00317]WNG86098.1 TetR/AcrR family transcriptional regulator [Mycobacterium sp. ITM-2016-00317]